METKTRIRRHPDESRARILDEAIKQAEKVGYKHISRSEIARNLGISRSLINTYFGTAKAFERLIVKEAVARKNTRIIAQAFLNKEKLVGKVGAAALQEIARGFE